MIVKKLSLDGALTVKPEMHEDSRGAFGRIFCQSSLSEHGWHFEVAQVNHSVNAVAGTVRGLHFQHPPYAEKKMVKCIKGCVYDVIVDLRQQSPTFLQWEAVTLSADNRLMIGIPQGFAHGFQVLESGSELLYFHSDPYVSGSEGAIKYDDPAIGIEWPSPVSLVSERDQHHSYLPADFKGLVV